MHVCAYTLIYLHVYVLYKLLSGQVGDINCTYTQANACTILSMVYSLLIDIHELVNIFMCRVHVLWPSPNKFRRGSKGGGGGAQGSHSVHPP